MCGCNFALKKQSVRNHFLPTSDIRFEVIDEEGRQYVKYGVDLEFSVQDDQRTLKIFVKKNNELKFAKQQLKK